MFVTSKNINNKLSLLFQTFVDSTEKYKSVYYIFKREPEFTNILVSDIDFGLVERSCQTKDININKNPVSFLSKENNSNEVKQQTNITVRTKEVNTYPRITGITLLPPDTLLLTDFYNNSVKAACITSKDILGRLCLTDSP